MDLASKDWLNVIQLPACTPDLNPTENVWSHVERSLGNLAATSVDRLAAIVRKRLKRIQSPRSTPPQPGQAIRTHCDVAVWTSV